MKSSSYEPALFRHQRLGKNWAWIENDQFPYHFCSQNLNEQSNV